jgi:outer membrane protein TolC
LQAQTSTNAMLMDLPEALRLAGAQSIDVKIARQKVLEAQANLGGAQMRYLPWLSPGFAYRRHDHLAQDTAGNVYNVHRDSYAPGVGLNAQLDLGEAIFQSRIARQLVRAADEGTEISRQDSVFSAAHAFLDWVMAKAAVTVNQEAIRIATDYEQQLKEAVATGIAFKGDVYRARVQLERNALAVQQAQAQQHLAISRLIQVLRLAPTVNLIPKDTEVLPLTLVETNLSVDRVVQESFRARPELRRIQTLLSAARNNEKAARYSPLIPTLNASAYVGGFGGSAENGPSRFGNQEELNIGLSWRIGPGGLLDNSRLRASEARVKTTELELDKLQDDISRQAVDALVRYQSARDQLQTAGRGLAAADEGFRLARQRKEYAVGVVLETIQAEQDLTRSRLEYLRVVTEFNQAQYLLLRALGKL